MEGIRFIFFDVGYTLVDESDVWDRRCREQAESEEVKRLGLSAADIYQEIARAAISYQPQYRTAVTKFGFTQPAPYRHELEKLYDGTDHVLRSLSKRYGLGIIANQTENLTERLQTWGILPYFSLVVSSWEYGIMKPDIRLFRIALDASGYKAPEAVMVGDRLDNDIFPAKALGMRTVWLRQGFGAMQRPRSAAYTPDEQAEKLSDLLYLI